MAELEERLAKRLFFDTDGKPRPDTFDEEKKLLSIAPKKRVEVLENPQRKGVWIVLVNNVEIGSFVGPLAQMKATRLAGKYLNEPEI